MATCKTCTGYADRGPYCCVSCERSAQRAKAAKDAADFEGLKALIMGPSAFTEALAGRGWAAIAGGRWSNDADLG